MPVMDLISFPFRVGPDGRVVTVEQGGDAEVAEAIGILVRSRIGERPMCRTFGIPDPTWAGLDAEAVNAGLQIWGPAGVRIEDLEVSTLDDQTQSVVISYTRDAEGFDL